MTMTGEVTQSSGDPVAQEISSLREVMRSDPAAYWRDEGKQQRLHDLYDARDRGASVPAKPNAVDARIGEIEKTMRDSPREYYARDGKLQGEYLALLRAREAGGPPAATRPLSEARTLPAPAREALSSELRTRLEEGGAAAFEANMQRWQNTATQIVGGVGDKSLAFDLVASFDVLAPGIQNAVRAEMARCAPTYSQPADKGVIAEFRATPLGLPFLEAWGSQAARKLGAVRARFDRLHADMSAADRSRFDEYFDSLTWPEKGSIVWALSI